MSTSDADVSSRDPSTSGARSDLLVVMPDGETRERAVAALELDGRTRATTAASAQTALQLIGDRLFDLIIVGHRIDGLGGHDLCRAIRARRCLAALLLVGGASEADQILALDAGADDCIAGPLSLPLLAARVRAHLRRQELNESAELAFGACRFSPATRIVIDLARSRRIRLTDREAALLKYLFRAGGRIVLRSELLREVWGFSAAVDTHVVESHVYRLRHKIEPDPQQPRHLVTRRGGYALIR